MIILARHLEQQRNYQQKDIEFKDMPKWIKFRIRLFNFECDLTGGPKRWWTKFTLWRFYKKYPGLKD